MDIILVPKLFLMSIHFFVSGIAIVIRSCLILLFLNCFSLLLSMNLFLLPSISFLFNNKVFLFAAIFYIYIIKDLPLKIILLTTTVQQSNVELKYILTKILQELQILRIESNSKITKLKTFGRQFWRKYHKQSLKTWHRFSITKRNQTASTKDWKKIKIIAIPFGKTLSTQGNNQFDTIKKLKWTLP